MVGFHREQAKRRRTKSQPNRYKFGAPSGFDSRTSAHHPSRDAAIARCQFARCQPRDRSNDESCSRGLSTSDDACRSGRVRSEHCGESFEQPSPNTGDCVLRSGNQGACKHRY